MQEHLFWQVHPNIRDNLPLCLVDGHGEAELNGELLSLKIEKNISSLDGHKGMKGRKNPLSGMLPQHNFYVDGFLLEPDKPNYCKSICTVNVPKQKALTHVAVDR